MLQPNFNIFSFLLCFMVGLSGAAHAQQVAILDSGVDPNAGLNLAPGFNYFDNTSDTDDASATDDEEGHGTTSARVAAEAFNGEIVPFVVTDGSMLGDQESVSRAARDSALSDILGRNDIRVIGITRGNEGIAGASAPLISELSGANKVIAILAGNDGAAQPNVLSTTSFNLSGVIIVGGTDGNGNLLPSSNRAGTTANKYVAANGLPQDDRDGGSSWAAARIAGIAGAVFQQNQNLTAAQVVEVILDSAEDRGAAGTDDEYGRGVILNAEQVLNHVMGPVSVPTTPTTPPVTATPAASGGGGGGGGAAVLVLGGALAGALLLSKKPSAKLEKTLVLDTYGRAFQIDLNSQIQVNDGVMHLNDFFNSLDQVSVSDAFSIPALNTEVAFGAAQLTDHRVDLIEYFAMPGDVAMEGDQAHLSLAVRSQLTERLELSSGYQLSAAHIFGAGSKFDAHALFGRTSFISGQAFGSVLSGFSQQAEMVSLEYSAGKHKQASAKLGFVSVNQAQRFGQDSFSSILEGKYQFNDNAGLSLQFGQIEEKGSLFGGAAGGTFGVKTATTYALNLAGNIKATDKVSLVANYGIGKTHVNAATESLLNGFSSLSSDWYSVGMIANNIFRAKDQLGFAFSQPLKITAGAVDYSLPTGREQNGDISFDVERINLAETNATERNIEAYYRTMLNSKFELGSFVSYRKNPNHVSDHGNELLFMATLRYQR